MNLNITQKNYFLDADRNQSKVGEYILPPCKERWLTSAVEFQNKIIVGDREGSIHVFSHGVSCICYLRICP